MNIVPQMRNKFMHMGHDEDSHGFEFKAYDLLTDLDHLIRVFHELDNPLVAIKKIQQQKKQDDFLHYGEFVHYFTLMKDVQKNNPDHYPEVKNSHKEMEEFFKSLDMKFICKNAIANFADAVVKIQYVIKSKIPLEELYSTNETNLSSNPDLRDTISFIIEVFERYVSDLELFKNFVKGVNKYIPSMEQDTITLLNETWNMKKVFTEKILYLSKIKSN